MRVILSDMVRVREMKEPLGGRFYALWELTGRGGVGGLSIIRRLNGVQRKSLFA